MLRNDASSEDRNETEKNYSLSAVSFLDLPDDVIRYQLLPKMELQETYALYKTSKHFQRSINNSSLEYEVDVIFPNKVLVKSATYAGLSLLHKKYDTRYETIKKMNEAEIDSLECKQNCYSFISTSVCTNCGSLDGVIRTRQGEMVEKKWACVTNAGITACLPAHFISFFTGLFSVCPTSPIQILCGASAGISLGTCLVVSYGTLGLVHMSKSCHAFFNNKVGPAEVRKNVLKEEVVNSKPQSIRMHQ